MTEKLFYQDSHLAQFEAVVTNCQRKAAPDSPAEETRALYEVELSRTAFFPEGGGQYADT